MSLQVTVMNKYVFYINDIAVRVYEEALCTCQLKNEMKAAGFCKVPFETIAESEVAATDNMLQYYKTNGDMLNEFAKEHAIASAFFLTVLINIPEI